MPLVSVVIPTYNNAAHLATTLDSVLQQSYGDLEVIVSDHASRDDTWEIVEDYRRHHDLRVERIAAGGGAERNWNHVTSLARGDYVKLVCADDILHSDCVERQVATLEGLGTTAVMVSSRRDVVDTSGRPLLRSLGLRGLEGDVPAATAVRRMVRSGTNVLGEPASVLIRRAALDQVGGWDGRDGYVIELRTYFNLLRVGDLYALPDTLGAFRVSRDQWSARLIDDQARHVGRLLRDVASEWPDAVGSGDLTLGLVRAHVRALQRRAFYAAHRRRL